MKTIATLIATLVTTAAFATEPAKPATPAAPAATASAPAKEEIKLAKKKEDKKVDAIKSAKPATTVQDKKAPIKTEPATTATK